MSLGPKQGGLGRSEPAELHWSGRLGQATSPPFHFLLCKSGLMTATSRGWQGCTPDAQKCSVVMFDSYLPFHAVYHLAALADPLNHTRGPNSLPASEPSHPDSPQSGNPLAASVPGLIPEAEVVFPFLLLFVLVSLVALNRQYLSHLFMTSSCAMG